MNNKIKTEYSALSIKIVNAEAMDVIVTSGFNSEDDDFLSRIRSYSLDASIDVNLLEPYCNTSAYEGTASKI